MAFNNSGFSVAQQNRLFDSKGDYVTWFPGRKCSCTFDLDPNRPNPNCKACKGLGYVYLSSKKILGIVASVNSSKMLMDSGMVIPGDLVFSQQMMTPTPITDNDMVRLTTGAWPYEGELVVRDASTSDLLIYSAIKVIDVLQMDPITGTTTTYARTTDWTHTTGSDTINWVTTGTPSSPAAGSTYSVKYDALFDWVCFTAPAQRFERGTPLGNRVFMRKKHIVLGKTR
jgi:hypothetical protein